MVFCNVEWVINSKKQCRILRHWRSEKIGLLLRTKDKSPNTRTQKKEEAKEWKEEKKRRGKISKESIIIFGACSEGLFAVQNYIAIHQSKRGCERIADFLALFSAPLSLCRDKSFLLAIYRLVSFNLKSNKRETKINNTCLSIFYRTHDSLGTRRKAVQFIICDSVCANYFVS